MLIGNQIRIITVWIVLYLENEMADVTLLLEAFRVDGHASDELIDVVYEELRRIAQSQCAKEKPGQTSAGDGRCSRSVHAAVFRRLNWRPVPQ